MDVASANSRGGLATRPRSEPTQSVPRLATTPPDCRTEVDESFIASGFEGLFGLVEELAGFLAEVVSG
jgi:hypothetical protein